MSSYVPDPKGGAAKAIRGWAHVNYRLSVVLPRYLSHSDQISRTIRTSTRLRKRG